MNKLAIIGNLTRDPELRTRGSGINVCSFTVAVNRRRSGDQEQSADYFRVTAWRQLADICHQYLAKGRKVCVVGPVSVSSYEAKDGSGTRFSLDVTADDVEFLTPKGEQDGAPRTAQRPAAPAGFTEVDDDDLPF